MGFALQRICSVLVKTNDTGVAVECTHHKRALQLFGGLPKLAKQGVGALDAVEYHACTKCFV